MTVALLVALLWTGCGEDAAPDAATYVWSPDARQFFASHCTRCHVDDHPGGDYTQYGDVVDDAEVMRCGLASTELAGCEPPMPPPRSFPTGPRPPADEVADVISWLEAGLPR